jgi:eukaryotic-like serine/threonine-protein kinase
MPTCRTCNTQWPEGTNACPNDGFVFAMEMGSTMAPPTAGAAAPALALQDGDLQPGAKIGEYRVDKKIGEGGMGAVYSATHPMIGKRAAIKVISAALGANADAVGRFMQEAQSVNQIGHPNIVDVFAFGELPDGRNYFVMEYLQGQSLADRMHKGEFPLGEALEILDQVADALEAAHEKNIVHRDLKPDNVYLASVRGGRTLVKLLDFGIAKMSTDSSGSGGGIAKTRTGMMMGTPGYLSPEQARGRNVDHRTDIYALGCMTFEIACGRLPFVADNAMDIVLMHMTAPAPRASSVWPDIPAPLDDLIARMLEKEPSVRPSLQEVRATFAELVSSGLVTVTNARGLGFGSRMQTPAGGLPRPALATGTQPAQERPPTGPPGASPVGASATMAPLAEAPAPKKSKAPLIAAVAGVLVLGGAGAFFALKGGGETAATKTAEAQQPTPPPQPTPEPPKAVEPPKASEPKVVEPPAKTVEKVNPATIEVAINVSDATVTVDDKPVQVVGKLATTKVDSEGPHRVVVTAQGRAPFETSITTKLGETEKVSANLEKAKSGSKASKTTTAAKTTTTAGKTTTTTTATTPAGQGSGAAKKTFVDKNAPIDPF